jgi:uncharacterized protein (DUF1778 family)
MQKEQIRNDRLEIRLEPGEKEGFQEAAAIVGLSVSGWVRHTLRRAARQELESANKTIPFLTQR